MLYASNEWIGIVHSTIPKYINMLVDLTTRQRLLLALMRRRGRILTNQGGPSCQWPLKISLPQPESYADGGIVNFANHQAYETLAVDWRGYINTDSMSMKQRLMNSGPQQLINVYQQKQNNLAQGLREAFCGELYKDGEAADRMDNVHGLETFMNHDSGNVAAGDRLAIPDDTYGMTRLSTQPGQHGGFWSADMADPHNATLGTDWPDGNGVSEYDFLAPKLVNYTSNNWGTGSTEWVDNCWRVIDQTIDWLSLTNGPGGRPDMIVLSSDLHTQYKQHWEVKQRLTIPHKESQDLGFTGILNQDGVAIQQDFDCPPGTGYAINVSKMEIRSLAPNLFWSKPPSEDPHTAWSYQFGTGFWGNATFCPKHFAKLGAFA